MYLERFLKAQENTYDEALREIKNGKKETHWMWYIFPQITGLGKSIMDEMYGIYSIREAKEYLSHPILGSRLRTITTALLELDTNNPNDIFSPIDTLKLNSSMTLFFYVSKEELFVKAIDKYYGGKQDELTLKICKNLESSKTRKIIK